ncbi:MAG: hypothetical protein P1P81_06055 [Desulfobulbales bacterium]|nr:hypothetical protein [Desulfobulbales bacterium]
MVRPEQNLSFSGHCPLKNLFHHRLPGSVAGIYLFKSHQAMALLGSGIAPRVFLVLQTGSALPRMNFIDSGGLPGALFWEEVACTML